MPAGDAQLFKLKDGKELVLASSSPKRKEFFSSLGLPFTAFYPQSEPLPDSMWKPHEYALLAARSKAIECRNNFSGCFSCIIGADTVVVLKNQILGKPKNHDEALEMLLALNGHSCNVISAACLIFQSGEILDLLDMAEVVFHHWSEEILASYAHDREPLDKAGAFAIQGKGAFLINRIEGSYTTVVGIPGAQIVTSLLSKNVICPASSFN